MLNDDALDPADNFEESKGSPAEGNAASETPSEPAAPTSSSVAASSAPDDDDAGKRSGKRYTQLSERSRCRFTRAGVKHIDYKDVMTLQKLMTAQGKMLSRKRTGIAARYQRMVKIAIKRARFMALLPYQG